jgi:hydrogen cyanide synthase HcnC
MGVKEHDAIVVGGGLVGAAIAYGLVEQGLTTLLLDEGDVAHRASRGNFGLVWVQSKGFGGASHYQRWSRRSALQWQSLAARLADATGIDVGLRQPGGVHLCLSEQEFAERGALMARMREDVGDLGFDYRMLSHAELADRLPGLGPEVVGASWTPYDGHASPLLLLRGLHAAFVRAGGIYRPLVKVNEIDAAPGDFRLLIDGRIERAPRLVLAGGLGNASLAPKVGLICPVQPQRGEIVVTERARQILPIPTTHVRQTVEGALMIGDSKEEAVFDSLTQHPAIMRTMADRAVRAFPWIADLNIVRAWTALRVLPPDGFPIYQQSRRYPGAYIASCHSGVSLAGAHAQLLAPMIAAGNLETELALFSADRFENA